MTPRLEDLSRASWFKSTHSDNGGTCVEVTADFPGVVPVRDSKDPAGPALLFPSDSWRSFVASVQAGEFGTI
ncbi:DUF397 domain-containing protein [Kitasatospora purpeofusca]|uniref:DUF397 domain-containing protein n=1 Tax=Kitasatospora purpeofusca TaxID=67352 RepID=UPI00386F0743|nr:DUF397 domain-containing protein [Kitasatospora purpeofusca]